MHTFNDLLYGGPRWDVKTRANFKGGGSTTSTQYTSNLPEYAEPYYTSLMEDAEAVSAEDYTPYAGPRVSAFNQLQQGAFQGSTDLYNYGNPVMDYGADAAGAGADIAYETALSPDVQSSYMGVAPIFDTGIRDYYMSPYAEGVTDVLKEEAILDAQRAKILRDQQAVQAGAFGGDRRFVGDYLAEEGLMRNLSRIEAEGLQNAYLNAQEQFQRDRDALMRSDEFGASMDFDIDQFNRNFGLDAANTMYAGADILGTLGQNIQAADIERINQIYDMGGVMQSREQQLMDTAYEDFINQRDYDRNALTWLSGILHGVPVSAESNVVQYQPSPNAFSQALGTGIAGAGLYGAFTG